MQESECPIFNSEIRDGSGRRLDITLTKKTLSWQRKSSSKTSERSGKESAVSLEDVVAVTSSQKFTKGKKKREATVENPTNIEIVVTDSESCNDAVEVQFSTDPSSSESICGFVIHIAKKSSGGHSWKIRKQIFHGEQHLCKRWIQFINLALSRISRPKNLLVFINPHGGKKRGSKIYERKVAPLFNLASIRTEVIVTERQHHAKEYLESNDLSMYDGIVAVGGDGMFNEIMTGLLISSQKREGIQINDRNSKMQSPQIAIGIIPAGSTDGVVYGTVGVADPVTSAVLIILGDTLPIDVTAAHGDNQLLGFSTCLLGYGFYGNVLSDSERMRWIGPSRYNVSGAKEFVRHREYIGEIRFLPAGESAGDPRSRGRDFKCRANCSVCADIEPDTPAKDPETPAKDPETPAKDPETPAKDPETPAKDPETPAKDNYQTVSGRFLSVHAVTSSCACLRCPEGVSPSAHLGDGCMDLILVTQCSRLGALRLLTRHMGAGDRFNFQFVKVERIKEFRYKPLPRVAPPGNVQLGASSSVSDENHESEIRVPDDEVSCWNCDGELIYQPELSARTHRHLIKLYSKGVCEIKKKSNLSCISHSQ